MAYPNPMITTDDPRGKKSFDLFLFLACAVLFVFSLHIYHWEYRFVFTDMRVHARIASEFNFADLHSITSRLAYPLWHLFVAALFQLGVPIAWASAIVCACAKTLGMWLARALLRALTEGRVHRHVLTLAAFLLMFVTGILIPGVNDTVYKGVGSPTVWHNPTQLMVNLSMLLCVPYIAHVWQEFLRRLPVQKERAALPWKKAAFLSALLMFSLSCKPTFIQALLPACAVFFLVEWIRHPQNSRFFLGMILVFLPAALYFLLQYLYYTGVVVEYTSGVVFGATWQTAWASLRGMLVMAAFPLYALVCCPKKGMFKDPMLVITLAMVVCSVLEAMFFRETGIRKGHGNFNWAGMSSALMLWVLMLGKFLASFAAFLRSGQRPRGRWAAYGVGFGLLAWHAYSGFYYVYYLFQSRNAF